MWTNGSARPFLPKRKYSVWPAIGLPLALWPWHSPQRRTIAATGSRTGNRPDPNAAYVPAYTAPDSIQRRTVFTSAAEGRAS